MTGEDGRPDRRRWELCLLSELRTALRSGAVWVQGSRRYQPADRYRPDSYAPCAQRARLEVRLTQSADFVPLDSRPHVALQLVDGSLTLTCRSGATKFSPAAALKTQTNR
ncbi:MAG: hypothetical protein LC790_01895 [Actinobacteria bacterium]|nr:hypothetical protein [Actinomycetota bacterium]